MKVPVDSLPPDVLRRVLEDAVTRQTADDIHMDLTLDQKVALVRGQLDRGEAVLTWDPETESVAVVSAHDVR